MPMSELPQLRLSSKKRWPHSCCVTAKNANPKNTHPRLHPVHSSQPLSIPPLIPKSVSMVDKIQMYMYFEFPSRASCQYDDLLNFHLHLGAALIKSCKAFPRRHPGSQTLLTEIHNIDSLQLLPCLVTKHDCQMFAVMSKGC